MVALVAAPNLPSNRLCRDVAEDIAESSPENQPLTDPATSKDSDVANAASGHKAGKAGKAGVCATIAGTFFAAMAGTFSALQYGVVNLGKDFEYEKHHCKKETSKCPVEIIGTKKRF